MPDLQVVTASTSGQAFPGEYQRWSLRLCLEKRKQQLPATHEAADYADECDEKLVELEAAIAADDQAKVREILDWTKATHARFAALRG